jgi:hypothetical protein
VRIVDVTGDGLPDFLKCDTVGDCKAWINTGSGLAKATLAGKVNGELVDASFVIEANSTLSINTDKDEAGLEVIRHSRVFYLIYQRLKQGVMHSFSMGVNKSKCHASI